MPKNDNSSLQNPVDSGEEQSLEKDSQAQEEINKITEDIPLKALQDDSIENKNEIKKTVEDTEDKAADGNHESITLYTMPKQFIGAKEAKKQNKDKASTDLNNRKFILLLVPLIVLLLAGSVLAYFLVIMPARNKSLREGTGAVPSQQIEHENNNIEQQHESPTLQAEAQSHGKNEAPKDVSNPAQEPPAQEPEPEPEPSHTHAEDNKTEPILDKDLIQKVAVSYNDQGNKTTEAVLSLEKEPGVNYSLITIGEYIVEDKPEYFSLVAGQAYEVKLRGQKPSSKTVLSITYSEDLLAEQDLIPADLRIGYLSYENLDKDFYAPAQGEQHPEIWKILKAQDLDDQVRSISSVIDGLAEGIYAIVPIDVNKTIKLSPAPHTGDVDTTQHDIVPALDTDHDLLTDTEELLYGTSPLVADSDDDGYDDGAEVLALYSPARGAGVALEEDSQFKRWQNPDYNYSIILPSGFTPSPVSQESNKDILFKSKNNEAILISLQDNKEDLTLQEWLLSISPDIVLDDWQEFTTKAGFKALVAVNKAVYYVEIPESQYIFVLSYTSPGQYSYLTTLRMMVESLEYHKT